MTRIERDIASLKKFQACLDRNPPVYKWERRDPLQAGWIYTRNGILVGFILSIKKNQFIPFALRHYPPQVGSCAPSAGYYTDLSTAKREIEIAWEGQDRNR